MTAGKRDRLRRYMERVGRELSRQGWSPRLDPAERDLAAKGLAWGVGPGDCACQIISNRWGEEPVDFAEEQLA
jgi:hypothetical protein